MYASRTCFVAIGLIGCLGAASAWGCSSDDDVSAATTSTGGGAGGGGAASGGSGGMGGQEPTVPTEANAERLATTLEAISADDMQGRLTGAPSGKLAEQFVIDALTDTGIEIRTQDVPFPLYEVGSPIELTLLDAQDQPLDTFAYVDDFREVDFSGSGKVTADLTFVGYGIVDGTGYDSYQGLDVTGEVVAILTDVPPGEGMQDHNQGRVDKKIDTAFQQGAAGVVFVPAGDFAQHDVQRRLESELAATDRYFGFHPDLHHADLPVAFVHVSSTLRLLGKSKAALVADPTPFDTGNRVTLDVNGTVYPETTCKNVFGVMPGSDPQIGSEVVILGAHYDHLGLGADGRIFNGAADNGTGTSVVLEAAASLMESGAKPKRTVLFALWCGEEQGLWGSFYYTEYLEGGKPLYPLTDTKLMIQVDYIGEKDGPYITNVDAGEMVNLFLGDSRDDNEMPVMGMSWGGQCASDDCGFLYSDVPAYRFIAYGDHHHVASDTFDNINLPLVTRVADVCIEGLGLVAF